MSDAARQALRAYESESWRRWEMDTVEAAPTQETISTEDVFQLSPQLVQELEQLRKQAREEGHAQGYQEGHQQGLAQGSEQGRAHGLEMGRAEGFEAGMQQALAEGATLTRSQVESLTALLETSANALLEIEAETGEALIHLAVSIAQQVLRSSLAVEPEKILDTIHDILQMDAGNEGLLRLRLHPDDLDLVQTHLTDDPSARRWRLQADPSIERGGCIAETALGDVDATLQTRWHRVIGALGQHQPWMQKP